jgi:cysteinyl-tRNA synthetase
MDLELYNTLTKKIETLNPLNPKNVGMYVCGPTVYDFAHIGNARPVVVFDVLFRLLRYLYGEKHVTYVRNITDVDDKINARAAQDFPNLPLNEAIRKVTEITEAQFHEDADALGALRPTVEPRATEHIAEMRMLIERLIGNKNAYVEQNHVLFDVSSDQDYGKLSRRPLDEMIAGARVDVAPYKHGEMDFVLWKPSKPGEPSWPSPGGIAVEGRPGWHIECSAMAWKHLGKRFDIHGGGVDLVFPHHENELAQTCCSFHEDQMASIWMHNEFLEVEGEKMSKSSGNFFTIHELLHTNKFGGRNWPGEVLRLAMLKTHYRQPIDWTVRSLIEAEQMLIDWRRAIANVPVTKEPIKPTLQLREALFDDLNISHVLVELHERSKFAQNSRWVRENLYNNLVFLGLLPDHFKEARRIAESVIEDVGIPANIDAREIYTFRPAIEKSLERFSITLPSSANTAATVVAAYRMVNPGPVPFTFVDVWKKYHRGYLSEGDRQHVLHLLGIDRLNGLIELRLTARARKDFKESDRIRDELAAMSIVIKDSKEGTTWEVAR